MNATDDRSGLAHRSTPEFAADLARELHLASLESHPWPVVGLRGDGTIGYINPAWSRFAHDNGDGPEVDQHWSLGANYFDAIAAPLRAFYRQLLAGAPHRDTSLKPHAHEYECSGPEVYRRFSVQVYALADARGHVLINSLVVEQPHASERQPLAPNDARYRDVNGLVHQCAHCRRVERREGASVWDWVPAWVRQPPLLTTHTVCAICYGYYYPGLREPETC